MTRKEIRAQIVAAIEAGDTEISFPEGTSIKMIHGINKRLVRRGKDNFIGLALKAGHGPDFTISYSA